MLFVVQHDLDSAYNSMAAAVLEPMELEDEKEEEEEEQQEQPEQDQVLEEIEEDEEEEIEEANPKEVYRPTQLTVSCIVQGA